MTGQHRRHRDPRKIVVGKRRVADMAGKENRIIGFTGDQQLAIAQMTGRKIGVDDHAVTLVVQARHLAMGEAKAPIFRVIGGAVGNPVRLIG